MSSEYACATTDEWQLRLPPSRASLLADECPYESIIEKLQASAQLSQVRRERSRCHQGYYRVALKLTVDKCALDLFHNSRCGYRAQYYLCTDLGDKANAYAIRVLCMRIRLLLTTHCRASYPIEWAENSLLHTDAKLWIHQGSWLRENRKSDRNLFVERWIRELASPDAERRKKAGWAMLTPGHENRLDVKGGFMTKQCRPLQENLKPERSKDLWSLGFT